MRQKQPIDPIEVEQAKLYDEIPEDATVLQAVAIALGLDAGDSAQRLIVRQLVEADRHVDRFARQMKNTRRAAVGVGFTAGVTFAIGSVLAKAKRDAAELSEHELDDDEVAGLLPQLAREIDSRTPERLGFALLLFEFEGEGMFYVSSAQRETMVKAMQEFVRKQKEKGR